MTEIVKVRCDWCPRAAEVVQHQGNVQTGNPPTWEYPSGWRTFQEGGFSSNRIHACPKCDPIAKRDAIKEKERKRVEREAKKKQRAGRKKK